MGSPPPLERRRSQAVFIRHQNEIGPMSWGERTRQRLKNSLNLHATEPPAELDDVESADPDKAIQYRLETMSNGRKQGLLERLLTCGVGKDAAGLSVGVNANQRLASSLHWMFRVNFLFLFVVMCTIFFALVIGFSGLIIMAGKIDPQCVRIGGEEFDKSGTYFANGFALSWTTFSTVGYGSTATALSSQNSNATNCFFINFICSIEALMGVLYSGFCGAILFGKVLRIQSHAQVVFSDPIVIRYGTGVSSVERDYNSDDGSSDDGSKRIPCPVLEFRIVNRLFGETGGEIMDATLNVVANVDADDSDTSQRLGEFSVRSRAESIISNDSTGDNGSSSASEFSRVDSTRQHSLDRFLNPVRNWTSRESQRIDEDPTSRLTSKQIFSKMTIEAADHPFFKRVWLARHELDEYSPILKPRVRRQIKRNGGRWPERLNSYVGIRDSLQFNQILVSLNGVSNVSASEVYAQRIYDYVDINCGYQFVNLLYRDADGNLGVDIDLINDVREQNGGGGEPLMLD